MKLIRLILLSLLLTLLFLPLQYSGSNNFIEFLIRNFPNTLFSIPVTLFLICLMFTLVLTLADLIRKKKMYTLLTMISSCLTSIGLLLISLNFTFDWHVLFIVVSSILILFEVINCILTLGVFKLKIEFKENVILNNGWTIEKVRLLYLSVIVVCSLIPLYFDPFTNYLLVFGSLCGILQFITIPLVLFEIFVFVFILIVSMYNKKYCSTKCALLSKIFIYCMNLFILIMSLIVIFGYREEPRIYFIVLPCILPIICLIETIYEICITIKSNKMNR